MPSITAASQPITSFPNLFASPFGNDGVIPLYSSIPINNYTSGECLPCVLCGNSSIRQQLVEQQKLEIESQATDGLTVNLV